MTSTIVVIHAHPAAKEIVELFMPFYRRAGCEICGVDTEDGESAFPDNIKTIRVGKNTRIAGDNLCRRLVDTFDACMVKYPMANDFCVVEWDTIFVRELPRHPGGFVSHLGGYGQPGFKMTRFYHAPWWADWKTAENIVRDGRKMLEDGDIEHGSPDCFIGRMMDRFRWSCWTIPWYSNFLDHPIRIEEARSAMRCGAYGVHAVKNRQQLEELLK